MALVERIESVSVAELHELVQVHAVFVQLEERLAKNRSVDDIDGQIVRVDERAAHEIGNGEADFLGFAFQDFLFSCCQTQLEATCLVAQNLTTSFQGIQN